MQNPHDCKAELRAAGSRATPGRLAMLALLEKERAPLTVPQIKHKLRSLNEVTLYRALEALASAGLLRQGMKAGVVQYEYAARPHHHHMVCSDCSFISQCKTC